MVQINLNKFYYKKNIWNILYSFNLKKKQFLKYYTFTTNNYYYYYSLKKKFHFNQYFMSKEGKVKKIKVFHLKKEKNFLFSFFSDKTKIRLFLIFDKFESLTSLFSHNPDVLCNFGIRNQIFVNQIKII